MPPPRDLAISLVLYQPDLVVLDGTLEGLARACRVLEAAVGIGNVLLVLVDNGPGPGGEAALAERLARRWPGRLERLSPGRNLGYGGGHNLAIEGFPARFHLVLNPDVEMRPDALLEAWRFLQAHPEVALVSPWSEGADGRREYLAKAYPSVLDLLLRGFAPGWLRRRFEGRLARYELRGVTEGEPRVGIPLASGCFMFCRGEALAAVGGFSPAFFMYFEDFDLSRRLAQSWGPLAYVPAVRIRHLGGNAAGKGWRHVGLFARSAVTFFRRHGWRWW